LDLLALKKQKKIEEVDQSKQAVISQQRLVDIMPVWNALLERETSVIAATLHNDLAQVVLALRLDISLFLLQHKADFQLVERANSMLAKADLCSQAISNLVNILRSPDFTQGLMLTLDILCQNFRHRYKIPCRLKFNCDCEGLDTYKIAMVYRLIYEALNNAAQHAAPSLVKIQVSRKDHQYLCIEISDDGRGFDLNQVPASKNLGILVMRECASAMGGQLDLHSELSHGTKIILTIAVES